MTARRSIFDLIENPEPGWATREIRRIESTDSGVTWLVQISRTADGLQVEHSCADLYVAWARATEAAHMIEQKIIETPSGRGQVVPVENHVHRERQLMRPMTPKNGKVSYE